ncbi:riboflavin synthase [Candidatus Woesearchaeota archaeon]|nr:riboflavin synthase [Candidatus Woesearchaeota archaeon]
MKKVGIADTMFSRIDMFKFAEQAIKDSKEKEIEIGIEVDIEIERYTVPGVKDLPVACKKLFDEWDCDIVVALGMSGSMPIDKTCTHEASLGIQHVQLDTNRHILEVFIHQDEAMTEKELYEIARRRTYSHTLNALALLKGKATLTPKAGMGIRQGKDDVGPIRI